MKYQLLKNDYIQFKHPIKGLPIKLYRIIALKDFVSQGLQVREGDIGGFIQSESNLSHDDTSWIRHAAKVFDNVKLQDSLIEDDCICFQSSVIDNSIVRRKVRIFGNVFIQNSTLSDNVDVYERATVISCEIINSSVICGDCKVERSKLYGGSRISGKSTVLLSKLYDQSEIKGTSLVENCILKGRTVISNSNISHEVREEQIELNVIVGNEDN